MRLNQELGGRKCSFKKRIAKAYQMVGESAGLKEVVSMIDKVAPTQARVLITGPNGTGKELVAHQLHEKGQRSKQDFIEVIVQQFLPN